MLPTEAIVITGKNSMYISSSYQKYTQLFFNLGVERFSNYSGYSDSFEWNGVHIDTSSIDENNRRFCTIVAIDAVFYTNPRTQFYPKNLRRELNKVLTP